jgi:hypothetical protein
MGGVVLLGAGVSIAARLPGAAGLDGLLWQALESDQTSLQALRSIASCGSAASAKETVLSLGEDLRPAWEVVASHQQARRTFQSVFARLDETRRRAISKSHDVLAEMLHRRVVELVISLNWDTQLETAWRHRYGQSIRDQSLLSKPHGSAAAPEEDWVLPGESPLLPEALKTRLARMIRERPRVLLVVGYSERDEHVVTEIVKPLENRWKVIRIAPDARGELTIPFPAEAVLPALRDQLMLGAEVPGFAYVSFEPAHDLGWAMAGRGLGPQDVEACPHVPEVQRLVAEIRATGSAVLIGGPGEGKSVAAFQAARELWLSGWEVVRLKDVLPLGDLLNTLRAVPRPAVAVLDDAQRLDDDDLSQLLALGGTNLGVLAVHSQRSPVPRAGVRLDADRATDILLKHLRSHPKETLKAVQALDRRVGTGYLDTPLAERLNEAAKEAHSPWHLTFVVTAGWHRVSGEIDELRANDDHDAPLAVVAALQLLRLDETVDPSDLAKVIGAIGRDETWLSKALDGAISRRLLVSDEKGVRLPHQRFAPVVLTAVLAKGDRDLVLRAISEAIVCLEPDLQGVHWLLRELSLLRHDAGVRDDELIDEEAAKLLLERCWAAESGRDRGAAAFVINDLRKLPATNVRLGDHAGLLAGWISAAQPEAMMGLARLINDGFNDKLEVLNDIYAQVDLDKLASAFASSTWPDAVYFGKLFDRWGLGSIEATEALSAAIDRGAAHRLFQAWAQARDAFLSDLSAVAQGIASFDLDFALECIELIAADVTRHWQNDFLWGFNDLREISFLLGLGPAFLRKRAPNRAQRRVARELVQGLDAAACAQQISAAQERDWELVGHVMAEFVSNASRRKARAIASRIDFDRLDAATADFWATRTWTMRGLLVGLALHADYEPARSWIASNADKMEEIPLLALAISPEACAQRLAVQGVELQWGEHENLGLTVEALGKLERLDHELASACLTENQGRLVSPITIIHELDEWPQAIRLFDHLDPTVVPNAIARVEPEKARKVWERALRGEVSHRYGEVAKRRRGAAELVCVGKSAEGPIAAVAADLERQFPVASALETSRVRPR